MKKLILILLIFFLALPIAVNAVNINNGDLIISEVVTNTGTIYSLDPFSGALNVIATGGPINNPEGMTITPDGKIIVTDWWAWTNPSEATAGQRSIYSIDPRTDTIDIILSNGPLVTPLGVVQADDGNLIVIDHGTNSAQGQVLKIDLNDGSVLGTNTHGNMYSPQGIVKDEAGNIYIADHNGYIFGLNEDTLALTNLGRIPHPTSAWSMPQDIIVAEDGDLIVATIRGKIYRMDPLTGNSDLLFNDTNEGDVVPSGSAFDSLAWIDSGSFAVVNHSSSGDVFAFDYDLLSGTITGVNTIYDDGEVYGGNLHIPLGVERYPVVPEPLSSTLFVTGIFSLGVFRKIKNKLKQD